ncbi:MAG TPA: zinc ribbon domain-containing protein [Chloroflexota bacterium]|nr:zinc ribbon domain-containing protein [Chloroflexota bacterium]
MAAKCERCGQPVLPDDIVCWRCGARLSPTPGATASMPQPSADEAALPPVSLATLTYFAAATAVTILLFFLLLYVLAQRPLVQTDLDAPKLPGWTAVTAPDDLYLLKLPPRWQWTAMTELAFAEWQRQPETTDLLAALSLPTGDLTPQLLARAPDDKPLLLLAGEGNATTFTALLAAVQVQPDVTDVKRLPHFLGHEQIAYTQTMAANDAPWLCQMRLHLNQQPFYWTAVCAPVDETPTTVESTRILDSFQPLSP